MYYTYILYSQKLDKFYVGSTSNIDRRLAEHNRGKTNFTRTGIPWVIVCIEIYDTRAEACQRESYIKKRKSRKYIEQMIKLVGLEHPAF